MNIVLLPLKGVEIDSAFVSFGMTRSEAEAILGSAECVRERCYYFDGEMAVDYDADGRVDFIEFLGGADGALSPCVYGVSVFDVKADELYDLLALKNGAEIQDNENGYAYAFVNISVGVYRTITPKDVLQEAEEMQADGICPEENEDFLADKRSSEHWATIGVGSSGYYS